MKKENKVDVNLAYNQWNQLVETIKACKAEVVLIEPKESCPDMVFTANAGLTLLDFFIVSNFKFKERKEETIHFKEYFENIVETNTYVFENVSFEGTGDALFLGNSLIGGYGFRTDKDFYKKLRIEFFMYLFGSEILEVELVDPQFYHLDTCFCPIDDESYLIYSKAFSKESLKKIRSLGKKEIEVNIIEANKFACNAVVIDDNIIMPKGCPETVSKLKLNGMKVHELDMSEFLKSGGACKCLTLRIK